MVWYSHLFKNFPQFVVIHTVKGSSIVNGAGVDVFLKLSCLFNDPVDVGNLISCSSAFFLNFMLSLHFIFPFPILFLFLTSFRMYKLDFEKAEEPEIKLPMSAGSLKK